MGASLNAPLRRVARIIETDLGSELILLDPVTQEMFSLNATGRVAWNALGAQSLDGIARNIATRFNIEESRARADLDTLLGDLLNAGLVERTPAGE